MKYYVICKNDYKRIYLVLDELIPSRRDITASFYVYCPLCKSHQIVKNREVLAETETLDISFGAILGGGMGILISPEAALICAALGSIVTGNFRMRENIAVRRFNRS